MDVQSLIAGLSDPQAYPGHPSLVELKQTHISIVCLVGEVVYKVKKPVKFPFLDFSRLEQRRTFCDREVQLNRRLAPDVYLGVVPVVFRDGRVQLEGSGELIDWAVKMRRLPEDATLENRLIRDEVAPELMQLLAQRLAQFHSSAASNSEISRYGRFDAVSRNILDNLKIGANQEVLEGDQPSVSNTKRTHDVGRSAPANAVAMGRTLFTQLEVLTSQQLQACQSLIDARAARDIPRDAHGDLHLDHVYVFPERLPPADLCIIDCIEFNDAFRYIDPVADLAFLVMDLKFHGRRDLAKVLIDEYFSKTADTEGRALLALYTSYRAAVRAKVETLKLREPEISEPERIEAITQSQAHWLLALSELQTPEHRPCLLLVGGLPGTGKSTLSRELAQSAGFTVIRSDVVRKELAGLTLAPSPVDLRSELYSAESTRRTYEECLRRAVTLLQNGERVIVDATFSQEQFRRQFLDAALQLSLPALFLICDADPETVRKRLHERSGDASDADWSVYLSAIEKWEPSSSKTARDQARILPDLHERSAVEQATQVLQVQELF